MDETALRRLLDNALLTRAFPVRLVPAPVPQAGIMLVALAGLPPQPRTMAVLRRCAEQDAGVLGCAAGNVNRHNARALATLQAVLG